jgi:hypothetical protein
MGATMSSCRAQNVRMLKGPPEGVSLDEAKRLVVAEMG